MHKYINYFANNKIKRKDFEMGKRFLGTDYTAFYAILFFLARITRIDTDCKKTYREGSRPLG